MKTSKKLFIIGGFSTALEILEVAQQYYTVEYDEIFNVINDEEFCTLKNIIRDSDLETKLIENDNIYFILGFSNLNLRNKFDHFFKLHDGHYANIIHPSAYISLSASIGSGNYIAANAIVSANAKIGNSNLINYGATIGHDAALGDNCIINPGARISGNVHIGDGTLIGTNTFILQGKSIGNNCQIDAMTYIDRDIKSNSLCTSNTSSLKVFERKFRNV